MGESASQAMYVAVYVFIFIIALSASIFLFNSIKECILFVALQWDGIYKFAPTLSSFSNVFKNSLTSNK